MNWSNKRHRLIVTWTIASGVVLAGVAVLAWAGRDPGEATVLPGERVEGLTAVLERGQVAEPCPIRFRDVTDGCFVYFVHSYRAVPADPGIVIASTDYGVDFASVVGRDNIRATQFHPEKSQHVGERILDNFARL